MTSNVTDDFKEWVIDGGVQIWPNWCATESPMQNGVTWFPKGSVWEGNFDVVTNTPPEFTPLTKEAVINQIMRTIDLDLNLQAQLVPIHDLWLLTFVCRQTHASTVSAYTLNLNTLRPTNKSRQQTELPSYLKQAVKKYIVPLATMDTYELFNDNNNKPRKGKTIDTRDDIDSE